MMKSNSKALYFDDYDFVGPDDIISWLERGADCNEWDLSPLLQDVKCLINTEELDFILIDYPFSRLHNDFKDIDITFFINTPLDIALGRRLIRDFTDRGPNEILQEIQHYIKSGRAAYLQMLNTVKPDSDHIIDGTLALNEIVKELYTKINRYSESIR